jgi:hypothetical protein
MKIKFKSHMFEEEMKESFEQYRAAQAKMQQ